MIRPFTTLCMLAAFGSGLYLYAEKHRAELLDRKIARVIRDTEAARQRTGLLKADWALLNDPGRLQDMSDKYLALKPMAPSQFVQLADLSARLPAPVAPPPAGATDEDEPDTAASPAAATPAAGAPGAVAAGTAEPAAAAEEAAVAPPVAAPPPPAARPAVPARSTTRLVAHAAPKKHARPVAVAEGDASGHDRPMVPGAPLPLASPQAPRPRVVAVLARQTHYTPHPTVVAAVPSMLGPAPFVGSALGGRAAVPPPVPYGGE